MIPGAIDNTEGLLFPLNRLMQELCGVLTARGAGVAALTLTLELHQHAGSFKARGAFANLLSRPVPASGVIAASGGNHGAAVAYAAQRLGTPATIFVPRISSPAKIDRIRSYGATLEIVGESYSEALAASLAWPRAADALAVHAFDQAETLLGQGTLAQELEEQAPRLETLLVGVGGGGLIGGIAAWYAGALRGVGVELRLHGCDPDAAAARAKAGGHHVVAEPADKPHGLREAYIADPDGYVWVPDVPKR